jgi:branched-chain amino acid transport system permease protein
MKRTLAIAAGLMLAALVPFFVKSDYPLGVMIGVLLAISLGASWNIIGGFAGQYSLGHSAYFGIGAYSIVVLLGRGIAPWWGALAGSAIAAAVALVIGSITLRLRGGYFVLASIAVAEILRLLALFAKSITNGAEGILVGEFPPLTLAGHQVTDFTGKPPFFYMALGLAIFCVAANAVIARTKLGYYLQAIREDQDAAWSLGIPLALYKNAALLISAALAAQAGALTATYVAFIDPNAMFGLDVSVRAVLVCILGGVGTVWGPVAGAIVFSLLDEALLRYLTQSHLLGLGVLLIAAILFLPDGLVGLFARLGRRARA